uniref:Uncharacterized protein n=1 Tax=Anguilla anguilla TaxID=7936 RepID=A0A0E9WWQ0_ANGAN
MVAAPSLTTPPTAHVYTRMPTHVTALSLGCCPRPRSPQLLNPRLSCYMHLLPHTTLISPSDERSQALAYRRPNARLTDLIRLQNIVTWVKHTCCFYIIYLCNIDRLVVMHVQTYSLQSPCYKKVLPTLVGMHCY